MSAPTRMLGYLAMAFLYVGGLRLWIDPDATCGSDCGWAQDVLPGLLYLWIPLVAILVVGLAEVASWWARRVGDDEQQQA